MSVARRFLNGLDNPIVVKEGVSRMRTWRAPVVATLYLGLIGAIGYAVLNIQFSTNSGLPTSPSIAGSQAFATMAFFQLTLISLFAPALAAGAISGERERQTLDVLLVSRVSAFGIVWGKLVASMAYTLLLILTALPLFAAVFLFGGVDPSQFAVTQLITIATAVCLASISIFFSALFQRSLAATVTSYAAGFTLMVGTAVLALILTATQWATQRTPAMGLVAGSQTPTVPVIWYLNPFFSMSMVLYPPGWQWPTVRGFFQLLFFGPSPTGFYFAPGGGAGLEPWQVTVTLEGLIAILCTLAAVALLRGRRAIRPRRPRVTEPVAPEAV